MAKSRSGRSADRRRFLKLVAFAGLTSAVGSTTLVLADRRPARGSKPAAKPAPDTTRSAARKTPPDTTRAAGTPPPTPPEVAAEARALAVIVQARYGAHLTPAQLEAVIRELENRVQGGKRLRATALKNSDEPDVAFRA